MEKKQLFILSMFILSCMAIIGSHQWASQVEACCLSALGFGPSGGGPSIVGQVYLETDPSEPVAGATIMVQYGEDSLVGCTYLGEPNHTSCPAGTTNGIHEGRWGPYYEMDVGGMVPTTEGGILLEPVELLITGVYTLDNQQYEASALYTLDPDTLDSYGNQRVDITLNAPKQRLAGADVTFEAIEGLTVGAQGQLSLTSSNAPNSQAPRARYKIPANAPWLQTVQADVTANSLPGAGLAQTPNRTLDGENIGDHFAFSVNPAGDVNGDGYGDIVVGAKLYDGEFGNQGKAYLFLGSANGIQATPVWTSIGGQQNAHFGYAVDTAGDVNGDGYADVIVGARSLNGGTAFVYHGSANGLSVSSNTIMNMGSESLGHSVSTAGDVNGDGYDDIIVGAYGYNGENINEGRVHVYFGSFIGVNNTPDWTYTPNLEGQRFGYVVDTAGDVNGDGYADILVGTSTNTNPYNKAYLYYGSSDGPTITDYWSYGDSNYLGSTLAGLGDVNGDGFADIAIGDPHYSDGCGRVFVFHGRPQGLSTNASWLKTSCMDRPARFSHGVGKAGDINGDGFADLIVGARYNNVAYLYLGSPNGLISTHEWLSEGSTFSQYGYSLSTAGDVNGDGWDDIIIGAYAEATNLVGRTYIYHGSPLSISQSQNWNRNGYASRGFAQTVNGSGDVNGDGRNDVLISLPNYDDSQGQNHGRVLLHLGTDSSLEDASIWEQIGQTESHFGFSATSIGDVNGDGLDDVLIGAPKENGGLGAVYLYGGHPTDGLSATPLWQFSGNIPNGELGRAVSGAGDVNGDGLMDFLVSASYANTGQGVVYGFYGSRTGIATTPDWQVSGTQAVSFLGETLASLGDINGDGYDDVAISAPQYDNGEQNEGIVYLYMGSANGLATTPAWQAEGNQTSAQFGLTLSGAGDFNGDGYRDLVIGSPNFDPDVTAPLTLDIEPYALSEGQIFLYYGSADGFGDTPDRTISGGQGFTSFGGAIDACDVNSDGFSDLIIAAPDYDDNQNNEGAIFVYTGSASGPSAIPTGLTEGNITEGYLGQSMACVGDTNGDGYADVFASRISNTNRQALLFLGNGGDGQTILPRQFHAHNQPLAVGGLLQTDQVKIALSGRAPILGDPLRLVVQVAPYGSSFADQTTIEAISEWVTDGFSQTTTITQTVTGLQPHTAYMWRARWEYRDGNWMGRSHSPWYSLSQHPRTGLAFRTGTFGETTPLQSVTLNTPLTVYANEPITLTATVNPTNINLPLTCTWLVDGEETTQTVNGTQCILTTAFAQTGTKQVSITASNIDGSVNDSQNILVRSSAPVVAQGVATTTLITLPPMIEGLTAFVTTTLSPTDMAFVTVHNSNGQPVYSEPLQNGHNQLDFSSLTFNEFQVQFVLQTTLTDSVPTINGWELTWQLQAQPNYRLAGTVLDGHHKPLSGANVQILHNGSVIAETQTDALGFYTSPPLTVLDNLQTRVWLRYGSETNYAFQVRYGINNMTDGPVVYRQTMPISLSDGSPFTTQTAHLDFIPNSPLLLEDNLASVDAHRLDDLAAIYRHTHEVVTFIEEQLTMTTMTPFEVSAYVESTSGAYYDDEAGMVVLGQGYSDYENSNRPMNREWHEVIHHLMRDTVGLIDPGCTPHLNHNGNRNCATNDSWAEGWAVFWSAILADHYEVKKPYLYRMGKQRVYGYISLEDNWKTWSTSCTRSWCPSREEFAVASLLWDLYDPANRDDSIQISYETIWTTLSTSYNDNDLSDMKDVYDALVLAGVGQNAGANDACGLNALDELFVLHGFFADLDGNRQHSCEEMIGVSGNPVMPDRRAIPVVDAFLQILTPDLLNTETVTLTVDVTYPNAPEFNDSYDIPLIDGLFYLEPFPADDEEVILILQPHTDTLIPTAPFTLTNQMYQDWMESVSEPGQIVYTHTIPMEEGILLSLESGWNLVTIPITRADMPPESIFADRPGLVYGYDGCNTADPWQSYDPDPPPFAPPNDLEVIDPTLGYWVYSNGPQTIPITGNHLVATNRILCEGWNLVSSPVTETVSIDFATQPISDVLDLIYSYEAIDVSDSWKRYDPSPAPFAPANDLVLLEPNRAYWVLVSEGVTWQVP